MQLSGKRVLVIGGGGGGGGDGIGRAITRGIAAAGAAVAVADLDPDRAMEATNEMVAQGNSAVALSGDVRDLDQFNDLVAGAVKAFDGLDVLVTVVGGQVAFVPAVPLHEMTDSDWDTIYELNLRYVARAVRAVLPVFRAQATGGAIVSVGSVNDIPLGRLASAHEIAEAVTYLASDAAAYVTGQALTIDGGASVRGPFG